METNDHWDKIKSSGFETCFVCDKKFKKEQKAVYIGRHKHDGSYLFRHDNCDAMSANWHRKFRAEKRTVQRTKILVSGSVIVAKRKPITIHKPTIIIRRRIA